MSKKVIVIGGGIAGLTIAGSLAGNGLQVVVFEKEAQTGGHVKQWDRLFPSFRDSSEVVDYLNQDIPPDVRIITNARITGVMHDRGKFSVKYDDEKSESAEALILSTGYELFDAHRKEEYGYGIYNNVITSADLEKMFRSGKPLTTLNGKTPRKIGIVHCVGSRDEKVGNLYCSKVCCVTGVKQAIEIKKMVPGCDVFSFYMDLRMFDRHFEEMYFEAQQKWGVNFIRGRLSECAETPEFDLVIKTEDTLTGRPLKMTVDMLVLLVGMTPCIDTGKYANMLGISKGDDGFLLSKDEHFLNSSTEVPGLFIAGTVKGPAGITETIADARAASMLVKEYLHSTNLP